MTSWPAWEVGGLPAPHPAIVAKVFDNGNCLLFAITHSYWLCRRAVKITAEEAGWAIPIGPLWPKPDESFICIQHRDGVAAGLLFSIDALNRIASEVGTLPRAFLFTHHVPMGPRWESHYRPAIQRAL
jgi:hypothetical protein